MTATTTLTAAAFAALISTAACTGTEPLGPPDADELSDLGVAAVPAYAAEISSTVYMCELLGEFCNPAVEESWFTVEVTAAVDVSGERPIVLPCSVRGHGEEKDFEYDADLVRLVPSGTAQAQVSGTGLDMRLAMLFGVELDDPFADAFPTDKRDAAVVDHDLDGKPGMTFNTWGPGKVQFGARVVIDLLDIDATADSGEANAALQSLDYGIFDDSIPLVNVKKRINEYLTTNMHSRDVSSATLTVIDGASCFDVNAALE